MIIFNFFPRLLFLVIFSDGLKKTVSQWMWEFGIDFIDVMLIYKVFPLNKSIFRVN